MGTIENENNCGEDMAASFNDNNKENSALVLHSPSPILPLLGVKKFESDVLKKQTEYSNKITDLEGRLASFHSRLAIECAEREREHSNTLEVRGTIIRLLIWIIIFCVIYLLIWGVVAGYDL